MQNHRRSLISALALLASGVASQASAADKIWSVPGVINNGLATVFSCSNGGTAAASVTVDLFNKTGAGGVGTGNANIPAGGEVNFVTQAVAALPGGNDVNLAALTIVSGTARITAPSGVFCASYVIDALNDPPLSMMSLPVIKKTTQKGD